MPVLQNGIRHLPGYLDRTAQESLLAAVRAVTAEAPLFTPEMPVTGKPMTVRMTNCGPLGWVTDQSFHPKTGEPWPAMPPPLVDLWQAVAGYPKPPEACLVNFYADDARMGLHQDKDETDFAAPVLSISLGNTCLFRVGGLNRKDPTGSFKLSSGDIVVIGGEGRLAFHGVDKIYPGTSTLLKNGGRINLTLRRVNS